MRSIGALTKRPEEACDDTLRGDIESIDVLEELLGIVGDVPGVEDVVDQVRIAAI